MLGHELRSALPISAKIGHKDFRVGVVGSDLPVLEAGRDLDEDERGGYRQRQRQTEFYRAQRRHELCDVVLYECFGGREYSDNPRSVHQELVRRDAPFEHVWVVRDGSCTVPETAVAVRELSREYYEAYASARYVVANDYWPRDSRADLGKHGCRPGTAPRSSCSDTTSPDAPRRCARIAV